MFSTSPTQAQATARPARPNAAKPLNDVLRRFYMLVHPDHFADYPHEKSVNEQSLKEFLSYIQEYKRKPFGSPTSSPRTIPLSFYVQSGTDGSFKQINIELLQNSPNPHASKKRLVDLFSACGIASNFSIDPTLDIDIPRTSSLKDFLDHGIFAARDAFQLRAEDDAQINQTIADLERISGVHLALEDTSLPHAENVEVLEKFRKLTDCLVASGLVQKLSGLDVYIGTNSEVEDNSTVVLCRTDSVDQWNSFLERQNWVKIASQRLASHKIAVENHRRQDEADYERKEKEKRFAEFLGVSSFERSYYDKFEAQLSVDIIKGLEPDEGNDDFVTIEMAAEFHASESKFLDLLLSNKSGFRDIKKEVKKKLKTLHITYAANMPDGVKYHLSALGDLQISTKVGLNEFVDILHAQGPRAVELLREEAHWEHIRDYIEVRLGLKQLTADKMFYFTEKDAVLKCRSALKRLYDSVDSIRTHLLSGLTLAVSNHYGISQRGIIYLRWDFKAEELLVLERPKNIESINESS